MKRRNRLYLEWKRRGYSTKSYTFPAYDPIDWSEPAKDLMSNFAIFIPKGAVKFVKKKWTKKEISRSFIRKNGLWFYSPKII